MGKKCAVAKTVVFAGSLMFMAIACGRQSSVQLTGSVPNQSIAQATHLGKTDPNQPISLAIPLKPRNLPELETLIQRLHTPSDPLYGKYLTPQQFTQEFAPSQDDYEKVVSYLQSKGISQITRSPNRLLINAVATVAQAETALQTEMHSYVTNRGRHVFANIVAPSVDKDVADLIYGVVGLNNFATPRRHYALFDQKSSRPKPPGDGPNGGLMGPNVKTAYSLNDVQENGEGQTIGVAEFDGYTAADISTYAQQNGISNQLSLQNISVDGFDGTPSGGADSGAVEVTLDLEMMAALAPGAKILVYEAPPPTSQSSFETEEVDVYTAIANDNLAKAISTSWGAPESAVQSATMQAENTAFMQMAAQGQTLYAAAGDAGAYDDGQNLGTDDPGSQPYVVASGGTHLSVDSEMNYVSESSWSKTSDHSGGGGGISQVWSIPSWQQGVATSLNKGSSSMRMVPDVAMDADPASGYAIYFQGQWAVVGGTSAVSPLLAAFTGLVNEARAGHGLAPIGNINQVFYAIGNSSQYSQLFHDVNDGSDNLYYPTTNGYDLSTGWGSPIGSALFTALSTPKMMNLN